MNLQVPQEVRALFEKLAALIWEGKKIRLKWNFPVEIFEKYKAAFREALETGWQSVGVTVDYTSPDMLRLAVMEANTFRFACAKADALARHLSTLARKSDTFAQFKKAADELDLVYNRRYLETEYNFAHAVGQNGAKYHRHVKEQQVFPYVMYRTVGDDRVREAHRVLDGKVFRVGSPAYDLIAPPNGWGCRCELNQIDDSDLRELKSRPIERNETVRLLKSVPVPGGSNEYEYMRRHGFDKNRGKVAEVFRESDFYIRDGKKAAPNIPTVEKKADEK